MHQAAQRFFHGRTDVPCTEETAAKLQAYLELKSGGSCSPQVTGTIQGDTQSCSEGTHHETFKPASLHCGAPWCCICLTIVSAFGAHLPGVDPGTSFFLGSVSQSRTPRHPVGSSCPCRSACPPRACVAALNRSLLRLVLFSDRYRQRALSSDSISNAVHDRGISKTCGCRRNRFPCRPVSILFSSSHSSRYRHSRRARGTQGHPRRARQISGSEADAGSFAGRSIMVITSGPPEPPRISNERNTFSRSGFVVRSRQRIGRPVSPCALNRAMSPRCASIVTGRPSLTPRAFAAAKPALVFARLNAAIQSSTSYWSEH